MRLRLFAAAVLVGRAGDRSGLGDRHVAGVAGEGAGGRAHGLAAGRRAGQLAGGASPRRTQAFKAQHPGVDVKVEYQSWGDYMTKFDATLAAGSGPDVIEFGNTEVPKYSAAGALAPLTQGRLPELRHVALGADEGRHVQRQALLRAVLRRRARRHLPQGPVQGGRDHEDAEDASPSSRPPARS